MPFGRIFMGAVVAAAFVSLLGVDVTQEARNKAAQTELAQATQSPAASKQANAAVEPAVAPAATPAPEAKAAPEAEAAADVGGLKLEPVAVTFPTSDRTFPPGPGVDTVSNNCTGCHSPGMILTQPKLTKATWTAEVNKMRQTYKAPVPDEDVEPIVAYLANMKVAQ